jgi:acetyl esterase/lipase
VFIYLHGGAFVLGEVELFDGICRAFVTGADVTVVSVDYRLAPEHRYPAAVDDCYAVLEWVATQGPSELGIDPDAIGVGGLSAGGGLAAALALLTRDRGGPRLRHQMLLNPVLDDRLDTHSVRTLTDVPLWTSRDVAIMWDNYLGPERRTVDPYAAPARAVDLSGLAPAYVQTSELDPLRDEGILYALRLLQAGVPVDLHNIAGTFHSFDGFPVEIATSTVTLQHAALRRAFRNTTRESL